MPQRDIVVIGGSAGGLPALTELMAHLPPQFDACVLVVMHTSAGSDGVLPIIVARATTLPVQFASDRDPIQSGRIYIAPADHHMIVAADGIRVVQGPAENGFRPAIDPLFRTAARAFGPRVIGVVLSGALADGTYGLSMVKHLGGIAIAQDPEEATSPSMPLSAIRQIAVDHVLKVADIAGLLVQLVSEPVEGGDPIADDNEIEPQLPSDETAVAAMEEEHGAPSSLTCPDCGGALWEIQDGQVVRYQCHVGHQYAPDSVEAEQRDAVDGALWSAVRVLEEHAELKMRMAGRAAARGLHAVSDGFTVRARAAHEQAQKIRAVLFAGGNGPGPRAALPARGGSRRGGSKSGRMTGKKRP
jgi:two-component system chemotaxis response regulator CheB